MPKLLEEKYERDGKEKGSNKDIPDSFLLLERKKVIIIIFKDVS